jgi:hypothetical protein
MATHFQKEANAIKVLMETLGSLDSDARQAVVDYVFRRLDIVAPEGGMPMPASPKKGKGKRGRPKGAAKAAASGGKKKGKRGRPKGSKNKGATNGAPKGTGKRGRPRKDVSAPVMEAPPAEPMPS